MSPLGDVLSNQEDGSYIPFPGPIPIPSGTWNNHRDYSLCFAGAWLPAILGALKSLTRAETWDGDDAQRRDASSRAMDMLRGMHSPCSRDTCADWSLNFVDLNGHTTVHSTGLPIGPCAISLPSPCVGINAHGDVVVPAIDFQIVLLPDFPPGPPEGLRGVYFYVQNAVIGDDVTFSWLDCSTLPQTFVANAAFDGQLIGPFDTGPLGFNVQANSWTALTLSGVPVGGC